MLYLIVHIYIQANQADAFHQYESRVLPVFKTYGGIIIGAYRPEKSLGDTGIEIPYEIHILSIPTEEAFVAYRNDPKVQGLMAERVRVIRKMDIFRSTEAISY